MSQSIFYGPYFLPIISSVFIISGFYSLITKKVLIPPRNINPQWMAGKWAVIWGYLQIIVAILFMAIYLQRSEIYHP